MQMKQVQKLIDKAMATYKMQIKKRLAVARREVTMQQHRGDETVNWAVNEVLRLERMLVKGHPFDRTLRKRDLRFVSKNTEIDLVNETGHSYGWWELLKRINGHLCLNTYIYSPTTGRHISSARGTLQALGIKFLEIDAPRGLQSLDSANQYAATEYGKAVIQHRYARTVTYVVGTAMARIRRLEKIGAAPTERMLEHAVEQAELNRSQRLEAARAVRVAKAGKRSQLCIVHRGDAT